MRILHLSDIHFGRHYEQYHEHGIFENRQLILSDLLTTLGKMDAKIDHIIMTGDIAWHGEKQEFQEALLWFQELLKVTGLTPNNISFCPGNHDVNRKYANFSIRTHDGASEGLLHNYLTIPIDQLDDHYQYEHIYLYETPLENYNWFCSQLGVTPFLYPVEDDLHSSYSIGYKDIFGGSGEMVRIVSFNTALFSALKSFPDDKNIIGLPQIIDLLKYGIIGNDETYKIAILHHAERYLHPDEISEYNSRKPALPFLREKVDLLLCGHTETGGKPVLYHQDNGAYTLTAGAAYYDDQHPNSFSIVSLGGRTSKPRIEPYINKDLSWEQIDDDGQSIEIRTINRLPKIGEMTGSGKYRLISGDHTYELPIERLELRSSNGISGKLSNKCDPSRLLDVEAEGPLTQPGTSTHHIKISDEKQYSVAANLAAEKLKAFMSKGFESSDGIRFELIDQHENVLLGSDISTVNNSDSNETNITILEWLRKIEEYYDIRFKCPNEFYSSDLRPIKTILQLIEKGYILFPVNSFIMEPSTMIGSKEELKKMLRAGLKDNRFYFECIDDFEYTACGRIIEAHDQYIITGPYAVDLFDLTRKNIWGRPGSRLSFPGISPLKKTGINSRE